MRINHYLFCTCIAVYAASSLNSCKSDEPENSGGTSVDAASTLKLDRLDISDAKTLALTENSTKSKAADNGNALCKIDAEGNMSTVVLYVTESADGTTSTTRTDISVVPKNIYNFDNRYTYFFDCSFTDQDGQPIWMQQYYPDMGHYFNILVQNSTGKIYCVPESAHRFFPTTDSPELVSCTTDKDGNLYLYCAGYSLVKVTLSSDEAVVSTYGPEELHHTFSSLHVLDNGTLISLRHDNMTGGARYFSALYPNGGYDRVSGTEEGQYNYYFNGRNLIAAYTPDANTTTEWRDGYRFYCNEDVSVSIVPINVGTQFGSISVGSPISTLTGKNSVETDYRRQPSGDWTDDARIDGTNRRWDIYETDQYYLIGTSLAYNKETHQWRDMVKEGLKEHIIFPDNTNVYHGKSWHIYADCADWFDMESFTFGRVTFPTFNNYSRLNEVIDIPNGQYILTMRSPVDGKKHIFTINIETGTYTETILDNNVDAIHLIPLN